MIARKNGSKSDQDRSETVIAGKLCNPYDGEHERDASANCPARDSYSRVLRTASQIASSCISAYAYLTAGCKSLNPD